MNGYFKISKKISKYPQRAEIGRLRLPKGGRFLIARRYFKVRSVSTFSRTLGVNPLCWKFDLKHYAGSTTGWDSSVSRRHAQPTFSFRDEYLRLISRYGDHLCLRRCEGCDRLHSQNHTSLLSIKKNSRSRWYRAGIKSRTLETVVMMWQRSRTFSGRYQGPPRQKYDRQNCERPRLETGTNAALGDLKYSCPNNDAARLLFTDLLGGPYPKFPNHPKLAPNYKAWNSGPVRGGRSSGRSGRNYRGRHCAAEYYLRGRRA